MSEEIAIQHHPLVARAAATLEQHVFKVAGYAAFARVYQCASEEDEAVGHAALAEMKLVGAEVDGERKALVEPIKAATSEVDRLFREGVAKPLQEMQDTIKQKLSIFAAERLRIQREAEAAERKRIAEARAEQQRLIDEAAAAARLAQSGDDFERAVQTQDNEEALRVAQEAEVQATRALAQQQAPVAVQVGNAKGSYKTKLVVSIHDPSLVPDIYWRPSIEAVQSAVDQGARDIPGVTIVEEVVVSNRRR